ncbi:MAG: ABC transporter ATP-binding protein/permease [Desulfobacterales bacterium]|jgi:ATP-binding cassette subfamily B protein|nr:ABC transporter ATP-binding protein/permease [Desulfobacterales bacterium]
MKSFKTLKNDFIANRLQILIGLIALLIVDVLQLFIPRVIKYVIDDLTLGIISPSRLLLYGLEVLILALGIGSFRYIWRYFLLGTARRIEKALRDRLFIHLQTLSSSYFSHTKVGDLMAHATNDIDAVRMSLSLGVVFLMDTIILGVLTIFFMIFIHPKLTLFAILPMPLITLITLLFSRSIHHRFEILQKTFASLTERVREAIAGIRVIKAYVLEERETEKLSHLSQDYIQKNLNVTKVWGMFFPVILFFSNLSMAIVLYLGGKLTIFQSISTGDFVAFMSYLGLLAWPMMALGWAINVIQRGSASMDRLNRIFEETPEISDSSDVIRLGPLKGRIEMRGLTFSPGNGGNPLLQDIHLTVEEGERMVVVGRTGSGKTILCNLVARILEPRQGYLFFDGIEIHEIPLEVLRKSVGYVPQDTFLFLDTIRENIAFGKLDATDKEIEEAARLAQIYDEIMEFPEGPNTVIGEKGITLSGGQRQRIAIARAILMNPPIFILDDALSSVDIQTEERILEGLEKFLQGKTSILITHRIAPLRRADRIIVLEQGRVAEMGDHNTLLSKGGIYTDLYWQRQLEEELEKENSGTLE